MVKLRPLVFTALFTALIAVGAYIRIPLPPVPFTLQTLFVGLAGTLLGARYGALSALLYVALGLIGLPVFTGGGGFAYVLQPTFGYLIGFIFGAYLTGVLANAGSPTFLRLFTAGLAGLGVIYAFGLAYYWLISTLYLGKEIGLWPLLLNCFLMTLPGDIALCAAGALAARRLMGAVRKYGIG